MTVRSLFATTVAFLLLVVFSKSFADEIIRVRVKENKVACVGVGEMECLQVKFKKCQKWENLYSAIEGFDYHEGVRYTLLVNKKKREYMVADAGAYTYELVRIVRQKKKRMPENNLVNTSAISFLAKHRWVLIQLNGKTQQDQNVYITFSAHDNSVNGNSGCNRFFGPVKIGKEDISFDQLGSTRMYCSPDLNKLENEFLSTLGAKHLRFDIAEQTFNVYNGDKLVAMFGMNPL